MRFFSFTFLNNSIMWVLWAHSQNTSTMYMTKKLPDRKSGCLYALVSVEIIHRLYNKLLHKEAFDTILITEETWTAPEQNNTIKLEHLPGRVDIKQIKSFSLCTQASESSALSSASESGAPALISTPPGWPEHRNSSQYGWQYYCKSREKIKINADKLQGEITICE